MTLKDTFARMKSRWGVGPLGVVAILLSFSLAGSSIVFVRRPVMNFLLPAEAAMWLKVVVYMLVVFPIYQALLLAYGALLGKFRFFWEREKRLAQHIWRFVFQRQAR